MARCTSDLFTRAYSSALYPQAHDFHVHSLPPPCPLPRETWIAGKARSSHATGSARACALQAQTMAIARQELLRAYLAP
jgi:hypothetical protein